MLGFPFKRRALTYRCKSKLRSRRRPFSTNSEFFKVSEEVRDALHSKKPVVALETTIYTHGFPYPDNIALSSQLESAVRANGGIPATIGVLNGVARVGFQTEELIELLASAGSRDTIKVSRRDLGYICGLGVYGRKLNGGTTIAGTMILAHMAGIKVFATGGLGGVHKGGENSLDVSADLTELGRTPVALISSGCKSFLDIPRTLEYLETQGVGVNTFADGRIGEKIDFPAFWTRESGIRSPSIVADEKEAAAMIFAQMDMQLSSGMLFANPIPGEYSLSKDEMDRTMAIAIDEANQTRIFGNENTPFILKRIRELTKGTTVNANRALVMANVIRGTKVAVELAKLELRNQGVLDRDFGRLTSPGGDHASNRSKSLKFSLASNNQTLHFDPQSKPPSPKVDVIVAGSLAIDLSCDYAPMIQRGSKEIHRTPNLQTSNPAIISQSLGGVGQNLTTSLFYLGTSVRLCSAIADDPAGKTALTVLNERGMETDSIEVVKDGSQTAQYVAFNDLRKDLVIAMADMSILDKDSSNFLTRWKPHLDRCKPKWLVLDANWSAETLQQWVSAARTSKIKIAYEPVSEEKSGRIFNSDFGRNRLRMPLVDFATPNKSELEAMWMSSRPQLSYIGSWPDVLCQMLRRLYPNLIDGIVYKTLGLLPFIPRILTTLGPKGVLMTELLYAGDPRLTDGQESRYVLEVDEALLTERFDRVAGVYVRYFSPIEKVSQAQIISVNGVGDTFLGIVVAGLAKEDPKSVGEIIDIAQRGAVMTLKSKESVSPEIRKLLCLL